MNKFEEVYRALATQKNYVDVNYPRLDNWAVDRYERSDGLFAGMSDGGYCRWVGQMVSGKVIWRVNDYYPKPIEYVGIDEQAFQELKL